MVVLIVFWAWFRSWSGLWLPRYHKHHLCFNMTAGMVYGGQHGDFAEQTKDGSPNNYQFFLRQVLDEGFSFLQFFPGYFFNQTSKWAIQRLYWNGGRSHNVYLIADPVNSSFSKCRNSIPSWILDLDWPPWIRYYQFHPLHRARSSRTHSIQCTLEPYLEGER